MAIVAVVPGTWTGLERKYQKGSAYGLFLSIRGE